MASSIVKVGASEAGDASCWQRDTCGGGDGPQARPRITRGRPYLSRLIARSDPLRSWPIGRRRDATHSRVLLCRDRHAKRRAQRALIPNDDASDQPAGRGKRKKAEANGRVAGRFKLVRALRYGRL